MPKDLGLNDLIQHFEYLQTTHDICVSQCGIPLYTMDIAACTDFLVEIQPTFRADYPFQSFLDNGLGMSSEWRHLVKPEVTDDNILKVLIDWNHMPSRVTYSLLHKTSGIVHDLNPDDDLHQQFIFAAGKMARIISRKLELEAYSELQHRILDFGRDSDLCLAVGQLALSLRWRISWWSLLGPTELPDDGKQALAESLRSQTQTVTELCEILYFHFCLLRRRLSQFDLSSFPQSVIIRHDDTQGSITEYFPIEESKDGFSRWMETGCEVIREARTGQGIIIS
jgi:hypothetical protein